MLNKTLTHLTLLFIVSYFFYGCTAKTKLPDLRESYAYTDNKPFGTSVAYSIFKNTFDNTKFEINKQAVSENYGWETDTASLYFNVSKNFVTSENDAQTLLNFVYNGNIAFIASTNIDTTLLQKIYCTQSTPVNLFSIKDLEHTTIKYIPELTNTNDTFSYFYYPFQNYFPEINSNYARVVGYSHSEKDNFIVFFWGKGKFYFHAEPRAFSNYFLLSNNNYKYLQQIIQLLPPNLKNIYWDNFYNKHNQSKNDKSQSSLNEILKYPALKNAFFLSLFLLLLYILFNSKRRQRIVPIVKPTENTTVAFAEAIAGLYLNKKDNKIIADKAITYFYEHLRLKYHINTNATNDTFAQTLSKKSGATFTVVNELTTAIKQINNSEKISDEQLLFLNKLIENFYKNI
ncbi:MAG: hypothetical protein HOO89_04785 [Ferruginibacter sp.]|nr:hypothetical protein [Ferruginibacter sp.]